MLGSSASYEHINAANDGNDNLMLFESSRKILGARILQELIHMKQNISLGFTVIKMFKIDMLWIFSN